ncbi:hypothetical protein XCY_000059 [Xanthomonas euroxanthea]|uniref:hypothetical protein n=1 Tax=Xanthomonas euroxanthea TaxID=2259622 RepID=UPI001AF6AF34|nr:hypothetical protein [Xanthomonas euroxanthea]CAG2082156.1 hypothetical protein XCY_000059 [Xanthomonas euroxanthea]
MTNIKFVASEYSETLYFTGGLVALPVSREELLIGPIQVKPKDSFLGPVSFHDACCAAAEVGSYLVGANRVYVMQSPERVEIWSPFPGFTGRSEKTADAWQGISFSARKAGDEVTAELATYLSLSLQFAGLRMREVCRLHNEQLRWALSAAREPGKRFSNLAMFDLHLAIHSLVAELCAARDYLATMAAIRVNAKKGTDSLARLCSWLKKGANSEFRSDPFVNLLLTAAGTETEPGWLTQLGEMRNRFMHRQPLAADHASTALLFQTSPTKLGELSTIKLAPFKTYSLEAPEDPGVTLLRFFQETGKLCTAAIAMAKFTPTFPVVDLGG